LLRRPLNSKVNNPTNGFEPSPCHIDGFHLLGQVVFGIIFITDGVGEIRTFVLQVKLTVIAVNLKRIAALVNIREQLNCKIIRLILRIEAFLLQFSKSVPSLAESVA